MDVFNQILYLVVLGVVLTGFLWWFRPFFPVLKRGWQTAQNWFRIARGLGGNLGKQTQNGPVRTVLEVEKPRFSGKKEKCKACGDLLSSAQLLALQSGDIRCTGSNRIQQPCPFRKLN
jgi:hypothetical protein